VKLDLDKEFITPLKGNRKVKLLETAGSTLQAVESLELVEGKPYLARLEGVPFDVTVVKLVFLLTRQHLAGCSRFKHENGHQGVLFLCSSETGLSGEEIRLGYQKRWPVEEQHKSGKRPKPVRCWCGAKKQVRTRRLRKLVKHGTSRAYQHTCRTSTFVLARRNC
jgi:hypothetical protein